MSWLIGAGLGFLRGGPIGAVVGGTVQHFISKKLKKKIRQFLPGVVDQQGFVVCLVALLTRLSLTQGPVTPRETRVLHDFFSKNLGYTRESLRQIDEIITETRHVRPDYRPLAEQYKKSTRGHYSLLVLAMGYQVGLLEKALTDEMQEEINTVAELLGVSPEDHDHLRRKYSLGALKTPYSILGVKSTDTPETIKKAYRRLVREFHPDRVAHLGDDVVEDAHIRFMEIQTAYQALTAKQGL